eukprot:CAMPEP_0170456986 /NCGR_PEP_ID=MMETSP0123-20130129/4427_1 /TAXON_ID=182087 /ORGANISM="Favella ehrenbergii, Strain Fehren 1" /LENGTH=76 /DNA_ID=CAMNT_0010720625 /DNA_START=870 /DNA_END=1100 /DNA_ORIENTATION=+
MQSQLGSESRGSGLFKPFEGKGSGQVSLSAKELAKKMMSLSTFNIKAADLTDKKSQDLYKEMTGENGDSKGKKKGK